MTTEETYSKINQNIINHVSSLYNSGNRQDILNAFSDEGSLGSTLEKLTARSNKIALNNAITKADQDELAQINPIISRLSSFRDSLRQSEGIFEVQKLVDEFLQESRTGQKVSQNFFTT